MKIAIVGTGYVADFYFATLGNHPQIEVAGVFDRDAERLARFASFHRVPTYRSLDELFADTSVKVVVNLTNPRNHYEVSRAALLSGKHVYTEKPLSTSWEQAIELTKLAKSRGLQLSSAPCTVLGECAQTLWKAVREKLAGEIRLVYAELDDGMIHREGLRGWVSASGNPWPYKDEFEVGCTLEHAGYYVSWLCAMFGPAESVTAFASAQIPEKSPHQKLDPPDTPDVSVGCIRFRSGVVARITCSIVGAHDHSMRLFGETGTLSVRAAWDFSAPVFLKTWNKLSFRAEKYPKVSRLLGFKEKPIAPVREASFAYKTKGSNPIDFGRGIAELIDAIHEGRQSRLSTDYSLHLNEIVLTLQHPEIMGTPRRMTTTFDAIEPMPWAGGAKSSPTRTSVDVARPDVDGRRVHVTEKRADAIGFGVIGTGAMARAIVGAIGTVDGVQLRAVGGRDASKAASLAHESGAASCSIDELIRRDDVDVIYVATPNHLHHEHVVRSLEAGKHVVCEKPFMTCASEVRDVMGVAERVDRFCMEAMWMRFTPAMRRLRELVRSGAIGEVRMLSAQMGYPYKLDPGHRLLDAKQGGGVVLDLGVYLLSLAFDVMGRPLHVGGALRRAGDRADGIDTTMTAILDYGQGRSAQLFATFEGATSNDATIVGPGGTIRVEEPIYRPPGLRVSYATPIVPGAGGGSGGRFSRLKLLAKNRYVPAMKLALGRARIETPTPGSGYQFQLAEAVECIRGGRKESPIMPLTETLAIHEAMDSLRAIVD